MRLDLAATCISQIQEEFPEFRIVPKAGNGFSRAIDNLLKLVTAGGQRRYLTHYHTAIGYTLYVPTSWGSSSDIDRVILLRHERVHLRQRRRLGMPLMVFLYLVPFCPLGLAYGRARMEWEAYEETLRATAEFYGTAAARGLREALVQRFTGPDYGWMWPFRRTVERWFETTMRAIERSTP